MNPIPPSTPSNANDISSVKLIKNYGRNDIDDGSVEYFIYKN